MNMHIERIADSAGRRSFIGGSDARIIMGDDEAALLRLWREKRGEVEPEDLSGKARCISSYRCRCPISAP
jgi:predicted phage-related endonuclease